MPRFRFSRFRESLAKLMHERLEPGRAAAAVFVGVFIGIVPIYGFQSLAAIGLAVLFKLNKPLTFAATFVNNPLLQPFLVLSGVQLGNVLWKGRLLRLTTAGLARLKLSEQLAMWVAGSVVLAVLLGGVAALATYLLLRFRRRRSPARTALRECIQSVNSLYRRAGAFDRGFVRWKMRLDNIFEILLEDSGGGPAVDLGCGYGLALGMLAQRDPGRRLAGCDLDPHRIDVARRALARLPAELSIADVRDFQFSECGLILILDVLQYLNAEEQRALLERCCSALLPGGLLLFRVPDREGGVASRLSLALDWLIFRFGGVGRRPVVLSRTEYRRLLQGTGMEVLERRLRNKLPLAHVVFRARKPVEA
ncbi:MAG: DUF2062 domain-containing protein [Bryobacteraceae bacterium]|jgi:uncharacterized protein (DUF2062 family)